MTGSLDDATIKNYYDDTSDIELTQSYCTDTHDGYICSVDSQSITINYTYTDTGDYTVTVEWEGKTISNGAFRQSQHDGDHIHVCTAASGVIEPKHKGRNGYITVRGKQSVISIDINICKLSSFITAPSSSPIISMISCECSSSIINWTYPGNDIVDGYVVNISNHTDYRTLKVSGGSAYQTTLELEGLSVGLHYNITVRAYQDILGPPSEPLPYCLEGNCVYNSCSKYYCLFLHVTIHCYWLDFKDYVNCTLCNHNGITMLKQNVSLISTPYLLETSVQGESLDYYCI